MPQTIAARNISSRRSAHARLWILRRIRSSFTCEIGSVAVSESRLPRIQRNDPVKSHDSTSGISSPATDAECRRPEEIPAMQSVRWRGIPCSRQGVVSPPLRHLVRAAAYRVSWSELPCQHRPDRYRDWSKNLQRAYAHKKRECRFGQRSCLDTRLKKTQRNRRGSLNTFGHPGVPTSDGYFW